MIIHILHFFCIKLYDNKLHDAVYFPVLPIIQKFGETSKIYDRECQFFSVTKWIFLH